MMQVTSAYARKHVSELLKQVQAGESIAITRYGKVVAILSAPRGRAPDMSEFRAEHGRVSTDAVDEFIRMKGDERY